MEEKLIAERYGKALNTETLLELAKKKSTPRTGYFFTDPDTGMLTKEGTLADTIASARRHRTVNTLAIPDNFDYIVEHLICVSNPDNFSRPRKNGNRVPRRTNTGGAVRFASGRGRKQSLLHVTNNTITLMKVPGAGTLRIVSQEEAERRAKICLTCPENIPDAGCYSCSAESSIKAILKKRHTSQDRLIQTCRVCQCFNKAQVHCDAVTLAGGTPEKELRNYPDYCWKKQTLKEYYHDKS